MSEFVIRGGEVVDPSGRRAADELLAHQRDIWRAWRFLLDREAVGWRRALGPAAIAAGVFLGLHLPYVLWRHHTYGAWLPNTVHAKFAPGAGLEISSKVIKGEMKWPQ